MKIRKSFAIDPALFKKASAAANAEGRPFSNWLSRLIEDHLKKAVK